MGIRYPKVQRRAGGKQANFNVSQFFLRLLQPHVLILVTTLASFAAWAFPDFGYLRKGLVDGYYNVSTSGIFVALAWIALLVTVTYAGYTVGLKTLRPWRQAERRVPLQGYAPYLLLSLLGWIGVAFVARDVVGTLGLSGIIQVLKNSDANALKAVLYDDYSIGFASLRYVTILSGALALYHLTHRRYILLSLVNLLGLGMVAIISSRLAVVATVITALPLIASSTGIRLRSGQLAVGAGVLFLLLSALNWSRNGNFYRAYGIDNWLAAGFSEILAYVGSAFQGFLAAATLRDLLIGKDYLSLPPYIKVSPELSTNSALLQLITEGGTLWAFAFGALVCAVAGLAAAFAFKNRRSFFFLLYGPLIYSFAELWRIYLFGQGIIKTLIIIAIGLPLALTLLPRLRLSMPRLRLVRQQRRTVRR